jgi:hypothetical protein
MKKKERNKPFAHYLAMWGSICTGIVYTGIGVIAILSFLQLKRGGADESSMLVYLHTFLIGRIFVWLILSGMIGYIIWRMYETIKDPYAHGNDTKGILRRTVIAMTSLADALIAYSAVQVLLGISGSEKTGQPTAEREIAESVLNESWGVAMLTAAGIILLLIAVTQMVYVINNSYRERLDIHHLKPWKQKAIHVFAWAGHFARGIILGIIGFFLMKAGITEREQYVVNTDKAFDFIGDHVGAVYFLLVACGTICYGLFMFVQGAYYDSDKH